MEERGFAVRLLPVRPVVGLVGWDSGKAHWLTLVDARVEIQDRAPYRRAAVVDFSEGAPALRLSECEEIKLSDRLLRRVSVRLLAAAVDLSQTGPDPATVEKVEDALVVLAAWSQARDKMAQVQSRDWVPAARLWRHRQIPMDLATPLAGEYPWITKAADGRQRWSEP
jgi:hypothetical protein